MSNVVDLGKFRENKPETEEAAKPEEKLTFAEIMRRNRENEERLKKERAKNNQSVTRSYRLKR